MFKKIQSVALAFTIFAFGSISAAIPNVKALEHVEAQANSLEGEAECLYKLVNDFNEKHKDVPLEKFDDVCIEYMRKDWAPIKLLNKAEFEEKAKTEMVLYRGVSEYSFVEDLKKGFVYLNSNTKNARGMGVYTTDSIKLAKMFSDEKDPRTVIRMIMPTTGVKILENDHLEKLKEIIRTKYPEEYGSFTEENKEKYVFDSASEYLNEQFRPAWERIEKENIENPDEQLRIINEIGDRIKSSPDYLEIKATRKRYYKNNKASIFYNDGLLTKLLGFDALYAVDYLSNKIREKDTEYLVVNPAVLSMLSE